LDQFPTGEDLATAYHRKKIGIIKLTSPAEVKGFWEAYSLVDGGNPDDDDDDDNDNENGCDDDGNGSGVSGEWQCPKCQQRFLQPALDAHLDSCEGPYNDNPFQQSRSRSQPTVSRSSSRKSRAASTQSAKKARSMPHHHHNRTPSIASASTRSSTNKHLTSDNDNSDDSDNSDSDFIDVEETPRKRKAPRRPVEDEAESDELLTPL